MPRQPRIVIPDQPLHIMHRGNNRQDVFLCFKDHQRFLEDLAVSLKKSECSLHAYVLMTNHFHLLLSPPSGKALSRLMHSIGRRYVRYFNAEYKRSGTLWEGRFKSSVIDSEAYLLTCYRYIEENPVRADMVETPEYYRWSSYHHNALGKDDKLITEHELYKQIPRIGSEDRGAYRELFTSPLQKTEIELISECVEKDEVLGDDRFHGRIETETGFKTRRGKHGGDRRSEIYRKLKYQQH